MKYTITSPDAVSLEIWQEKSIYILSGGFKLVTTNLPTTCTELPKGTLLKLDHTLRTATVVKSAILYEEYTADALSAKVKKNHLLKVGDAVGFNGVSGGISAIDTTNALYDTLTLASKLNASNVAAGSVVFQAVSDSDAAVLNAANAILYVAATVDAAPAVTALGQAYEIKEVNMPYGVGVDAKTSLGARFMFV